MYKKPCELSDIVDLSYLQAMLKIFTKHMKSFGIETASAILDEKANPIIYEENFCGFCSKIRETIEGEEQCTLGDKELIIEAIQLFNRNHKSEVVFHICKLGLLDFCAPIFITEKNNDKHIIGYFFGGQLRVTDPFVHDRQPLKSPMSPKLGDLFGKIQPGRTKIYSNAAEYKRILIDEYAKVRELQTKDHDCFKQAVNEMIERINSFVAELHESNHVKNFDDFMRKVNNALSIDTLFELVVNNLPELMEAIYCSIFTVQKGYPEEENCLVLRKTNYRENNLDIPPKNKLKEYQSYYEMDEAQKHLTAWVWFKARPLLLKDITNPDELKHYEITWYSGKYNDSDEHKGFLAVPIIGYDNQVIGVIRMPHKKRDDKGREIGFTEHNKIFLEFVAHLLAPVIERHELSEKFKQRKGLINAAQSLARSSSENVLELIMEHAVSWFGGGKGKTYFLNLHRPKSQTWKVRKIGGNNDIANRWEGKEFNVSEGLTGYMIERYERSSRKEPFLLHNLERATTKYGYIEAVPNGESVMIAPLVHAGKIYGVIAVVSDRKFEFSEKDREDLGMLAEISGDAIARTHLNVNHRSDWKEILLTIIIFLVKILKKLFGLPVNNWKGTILVLV